MESKVHRLNLCGKLRAFPRLVAVEPELSLKQIIDLNADRVISVPPCASVSDVLEILEFEDAGALVVSGDGKTIEGIISERDIVRGMRYYGAEILELDVCNLMSIEVVSCELGTSIEDAKAIMKDHQIRHLPILDKGILAGFISICDLVATRVGRA